EEALRAARQWRFEPARINGQAVPASFRLTLNFRLR
ncbi:MAG: TonB family protein, partial [Acidobacteriota bacterium]|nr:TonB family protein [Acidobacteriota bacterium]